MKGSRRGFFHAVEIVFPGLGITSRWTQDVEGRREEVCRKWSAETVCCILRDFPKSTGHVYSERDASAVAAGVISLFADSINFRNGVCAIYWTCFPPIGPALGTLPLRIYIYIYISACSRSFSRCYFFLFFLLLSIFLIALCCFLIARSTVF